MRGSGVINLSTGAIAMLGGYAFWALNTGKIASLPTAVALPLALVFVAAFGALTEFAVYRPLRNSAPLAKLVASLGVLLVAQASMLLAFGITPQPAPGILPTNTVSAPKAASNTSASGSATAVGSEAILPVFSAQKA